MNRHSRLPLWVVHRNQNIFLIAFRFTLSSEYIFELLKTDISFVSSDKIVTAEAKEHRKELLKDIRHALDSVFVFSRKDRTTVLKKEFEDHLKAYVLNDEFVLYLLIISLYFWFSFFYSIDAVSTPLWALANWRKFKKHWKLPPRIL